MRTGGKKISRTQMQRRVVAFDRPWIFYSCYRVGKGAWFSQEEPDDDNNHGSLAEAEKQAQRFIDNNEAMFIIEYKGSASTVRTVSINYADGTGWHRL